MDTSFRRFDANAHGNKNEVDDDKCLCKYDDDGTVLVGTLAVWDDLSTSLFKCYMRMSEGDGFAEVLEWRSRYEEYE